MNNQGNFPNMGMGGMGTSVNPGQNLTQQQLMVMMEQMMNSGNTSQMMSAMQLMNPQQRQLFIEKFRHNLMMMQQQVQGSAQMQDMMQEAMRMQGDIQGQGSTLGQSNLPGLGSLQGHGSLQGQGNSLGQQQNPFRRENQLLQSMQQAQVLGTQAHGMAQRQAPQQPFMLGSQGSLLSQSQAQHQTNMLQSQSPGLPQGQTQLAAQMLGSQGQGPTQGQAQHQANIVRSQGSWLSQGQTQQANLHQQQQMSQLGTYGSAVSQRPVPQSAQSIGSQGSGQIQGNMFQSRLSAQAHAINRNPVVSAQYTLQSSHAVSSNQNTEAKPKLKGILKNTQKPTNVIATQSNNVSTSQSLSMTQSTSVTQNSTQDQANIKLLKNRLQTYIQQTEDVVSALKKSSQSSVSIAQGNTIYSQSKNPSVLTNVSSSAAAAAAATLSSSSVNTSLSTFTPTTSVKKPTPATEPIQSISVRNTQTSTRSRTSHVAEATGGSGVEGRTIPTLVSSGTRKQREQTTKRKAEVAMETDSKKSKVISKQGSTEEANVEDEDPEHVQAQVFITNIPNDTSKEMILEILLHYKFVAPKVWIGHHNTMKDKICAFIRLPSLKDSKRVIKEMNGFPYKGISMEIRFSAAADFIDYNVPESGLTQEDFKPKPSASALAISDSSLPTIIHQPIVEGVQGHVPVEPITYTHVPIPVYAGVQPIFPPPEGYTTFIETDRMSLDRISQGSFRKERRRSNSPSRRDRFSSSPGHSSHRRYSRSPEYSSQRRYSRSSDYSPNRRYSRSPEYSSHRRSRSPSYGRGRSPGVYGYSSSISRSSSPGNDQYGYEDFAETDRDRGFDVSPDRGSREQFADAMSPGSRDTTEIFCVEIDNLPADIRDAEFEELIKDLHYDSVRLKVRDGKATASLYCHSSGEAKVIVKNLDNRRYMGVTLTAEWHREKVGRDTRSKEPVSSDRDKSPVGRREHRDPVKGTSRDADRKKEKGKDSRSKTKRPLETQNTLLQGFINSSYPNAPVLGKRYIKEFTYVGNRTFAIYLCTICEMIVSCKDIADHIMGYKHRLKCIRRSNPRIYDQICLIQNRADMLGQCAKYALQLEDKKEKAVCITTMRPVQTAEDHLRKLKAERKMEEKEKDKKKEKDEGKHKGKERDKRKDKGKEKGKVKGIETEKGKEKTSSEKKASDSTSSDSTSDIFKRIEALKKKYEAKKAETTFKRHRCNLCDVSYTSQVQKQQHLSSKRHINREKAQALADKRAIVKDKEIPAVKRRKLDVENMSSSSFQNHTKENKSLADSIQNAISFARKEARHEIRKDEGKICRSDASKGVESTGKGKSDGETEGTVSASKCSTEEKKAEEKTLTSPRSKDSMVKPVEADNVQAGVSKPLESGNVSKGATEKKDNKEQEKNPLSLGENAKDKSQVPEVRITSNQGKNLTPKAVANQNTLLSSRNIIEVKTPTKGEAAQELVGIEITTDKSEKIGSDVSKDKDFVVKEADTGNVLVKEKEGNKQMTDSEGKVKTVYKPMSEASPAMKNEEKVPEKKSIELQVGTKGSDKVEKGESVAVDNELFGEELGDMEEEDVAEEAPVPAEGMISSHPQSMLRKYFDIQLMKDPENTGIIGLQYVTEVIPEKALKNHVFICGLCDVKCTRSAIVDHIMGLKHRMKYFEVHHFNIYSSIVRMDYSRKFLNAECSRHAKVVQEKEGLKTIMTLSKAEFKEKKTAVNQKEKQAKNVDTSVVKEQLQSIPANEQKGVSTTAAAPAATAAATTTAVIGSSTASASTTAGETSDKPSSIEKSLEVIKINEIKAREGFADRIEEAKSMAKLVSWFDGRETVELYKYMQQKPDVPMLGLNSVTEIQDLYGTKSKSATYSCGLCGPRKKMDGTAAIYEHLTGSRHLENYLTKHFPDKMIHLKLIKQKSSKVIYLHNQAKLLCQDQLKNPQSIRVVNLLKLEEEKKALELAKSAAKAVEEAAKAEAEALAAAKELAALEEKVGTTKSAKCQRTSSGEEMVDLIAEEMKNEAPVAHLYSMISGLLNIPIVGLSYVTEIQAMTADKIPPRWECRLCENVLVTANYINAHLTNVDHRLRFLKANYPVFYSKAECDRTLTEKFCREIEEQFGRESISVKKRISVQPDGSILYSDPVVVKAPIENKDSEKGSEGDVIETIEMMDVDDSIIEIDDTPDDDIHFNKIVEGLDCTPMLGLQYVKEIQHSSLNVLPIYICEVCEMVNGTSLNTKNILQHICSKEHRLKFMKENHSHIYKEILALDKEDQRKLAIDKHTKEIESKVGRGSITKIVSDKTTYWYKAELEEMAKKADDDDEVEEEEDEKNAIPDEDQPQYVCKKCDRLVCQDRRAGHIVSVHMHYYKCKPCKLSFPSQASMRKHVITHHGKGSLPPKKKLNINFNMRKWFNWFRARGVAGQSLRKDAAGRIQFACKACQMLVSPQLAEEHYVFYHTEGYKCRRCEAHYGSNTALETHYKAVHSVTETVPVVNYTSRVRLPLQFLPVYSLVPIPESTTIETQSLKKPVPTWPNQQPSLLQPVTQPGVKQSQSKGSEIQADGQGEVDKYLCKYCPTSFYQLQYGHYHYKTRHQNEYTCYLCKDMFTLACKLEEHLKMLHNIPISQAVQTQAVPFEHCFDVLMKNGSKIILEEYLKQNPKVTVDIPNAAGCVAASSTATGSTITASSHSTASSTFASSSTSVTPASSRSAASTTSTSFTSATTTASSTKSELALVKDKRELDDKADGDETEKTETERDVAVASAGSKSHGTIDLEKILSVKEDVTYDWEKENENIKEKTKLGKIIPSARKSKFMMRYSSTFSSYPLVGLQMITEFQKRDISADPWYICELCKDRVTSTCIGDHLTSVKHRVKYMEIHHQNFYNMLLKQSFNTTDSLTKEVETLAKEVAMKEGRQFSISVMVELPPTEKELAAHAAVQKPEQEADVIIIIDDDDTEPETKKSAEKGLSSLDKTSQISAVNEQVHVSVSVDSPTQTGSTDKIPQKPEPSIDKKSREEEKGRSSRTGSTKQGHSSERDRDGRDRRSPRRRGREDDKRSRDRRSREEKSSRRSDRDRGSHRRRSRSRDRSRRDSRSPRSNQDRSGRRSEKDNHRTGNKQASRTLQNKSNQALKDVEKSTTIPSSSIEKEKDKDSAVGESVKEKETEYLDLGDTEGTLTQEELELIGMCLEEQLADEEEEMFEDDGSGIREIDTSINEDTVESQANQKPHSSDVVESKDKSENVAAGKAKVSNLEPKQNTSNENEISINVEMTDLSQQDSTNLNKVDKTFENKRESDHVVKTKDNSETSIKLKTDLPVHDFDKQSNNLSLGKTDSESNSSDVVIEVKLNEGDSDREEMPKQTVPSIDAKAERNDDLILSSEIMKNDDEANEDIETQDTDIDADFEDFIASELGADYVTVDDCDDSPTEVTFEPLENTDKTNDNKDIPDSSSEVSKDYKSDFEDVNESDSLKVERGTVIVTVESDQPKTAQEKVTPDDQVTEGQKHEETTCLVEVNLGEPVLKKNVSSTNESSHRATFEGNVKQLVVKEKIGLEKVPFADGGCNIKSDTVAVEIEFEPQSDSGSVESNLSVKSKNVAEPVQTKPNVRQPVIGKKNTSEPTGIETNFDKSSCNLEKTDVVEIKVESGDIAVDTANDQIGPQSSTHVDPIKDNNEVILNSAAIEEEVEEEDEEDIEEIFLGGGFVTVDTIEDDTISQNISADRQNNQEQSKSANEVTKPEEQSVGRNSDKKKKDKSESKRSTHHGSSSRLKGDRYSSSRKDSSHSSRHRTPVKSTRSSPRSSRDTSSSTRKSPASSRSRKSDDRGSRRGMVVSSIELGSQCYSEKATDSEKSHAVSGIEVNVNVLSKKSVKDDIARSSIQQGTPVQKLEGKTKTVDTCSYLGIPIKQSANSAKTSETVGIKIEEKYEKKTETAVKIEPSCEAVTMEPGNEVKAMVNTEKSDIKPEILSASKEKNVKSKANIEVKTESTSNDAPRPVVTTASAPQKPKEQKIAVVAIETKESEGSKNNDKEKRSNRRSLRSRNDRNSQDSNECEISIEIG